jgi:predicted AlkP superfamily phosphohydrolase/phosphomutase
MPEETWALNQGHLSEQAWLDMVRTTLAEGEAMLYDALDRHDSELVVKVFVQTDRVSHMFWRGLDETHPLHADSSPLARGAIDWIYREADRVLGEVRRRLGPDDRLIVLSDHGFASFRRAVHLNRWLVDHGYLALIPGADPNAPLFAAVDWSKTRAYALGLNGIFINRRGREPDGIVDADDVAALKAELGAALLQLRDPLDDRAVLAHVYDADALYRGTHRGDAPDLVTGFETGFRASWQTSLGAVPLQTIEDNRQSWSGDHCIDPPFVPGVLFSTFAPSPPVVAIGDLAARIDAMVTPPADVSP